MAKYDLERLYFDIQTLLANNLNTKLTAINTEKSDTITLKSVDSNAYFLQQLNGKQINYNPFILYGEEKIDSQPLKGASIEQVVVSVILVIEDEGEDTGNMMPQRMLRYRRALKEVFQDNFQLIENAAILKIQSLGAVAFEGLNSEASYRAIGVNLTTALG